MPKDVASGHNVEGGGSGYLGDGMAFMFLAKTSRGLTLSRGRVLVVRGDVRQCTVKNAMRVDQDDGGG